VRILRESNTIFQIIVLSTVFFASCDSCNNQNKDYPATTDKLIIQRFEQDMIPEADASVMKKELDLKNKYGSFFDFYTQEIMGWGDSGFAQNIQYYQSDENLIKLQDTISFLYSDLSDLQNLLNKAFGYFDSNLPQYKVNGIYTLISEFAFPTATYDSIIAISLDMFLGPEYPVYLSFDVPQYLRKRMQRAYIPYYTLNAFFDQNLDKIPKGNRLLDQMLFEGKKLYAAKQALPGLHDTLLTGWNQEQLQWLAENEDQIWTYLVDSKSLFSTDRASYGALLQDGPFTAAPNVPPGSAPRIAAYAAWKIVERFMQKNADTNLNDLFHKLDADQILKKAAYKP
jgi:hypothetical protein